MDASEARESQLTPEETVTEKIHKDGQIIPVVGIGASAGGIKALQQFFGGTPQDSGMAFVVILHLSPDFESHLANVLQSSTNMPVIQVTETTRVEPNKVFVIPPTKQLSMSDGTITLIEPERPRGKRVPVDIFFRTLAETHGPYGAAVVLSGSGNDGTLGLARIKEFAGVTVAQEPEEAEYDEMPRSAINTGLVDYVLPAEKIANQLAGYWAAADRLQIPPPEETVQPSQSPSADDAVHEVLTVLRKRTGHDYSQYKRSTILRRMARRMQVTGQDTVGGYLAFVNEHPEEIIALERDLLISVTNYFRDTLAFATLATEAIPAIFRGKYPGDAVRTWVAGCATGEEAYSIAILLHEHAARLPQSPAIQVFATDIDEEAISVAREGFYSEGISTDVTSERLDRFFIKEPGGYRIKKEIRESVLFAVHNVLKDPPFSRLDLISCRNLLIYLNRKAHAQLLETFHFALRPDGYLFLGTSETVDGLPNLFLPVNKHRHIFGRLNTTNADQPMSLFPLSREEVRENAGRPAVIAQKTANLADLHRSLLEQYGPPSVLVDRDNEIVHLSYNVGDYLDFPPGEPSHNLLKVVIPAFRVDLRAALYVAGEEHPGDTRRVRASMSDGEHIINLIVHAVREPENARGFKLVIFEDLGRTGMQVEKGREDESPVVLQLEDELKRTKEQLRILIEQYETSTEELKASNEELQAINEELRSTSEELETSKEELQAVNEELQTVNQELKLKVEEISLANNDLQNLLTSTDIGTIFLDRKLHIKRYTAQVQQLFNIIPTDLGRPLAHITTRLDYSGLIQDASSVLQSLTPVEKEVQSSDGRSFLMRLLPYRTTEDKIAGVVITFVNITKLRKSESDLREATVELERHGLMRTAELLEANMVLRAEAAERDQAEKIRLELIQQLVTVQEEERKRISQELHDELGQLLTGMKFILSTAGRTPEKSKEAINEAQVIADQIIERVRELAINLRPSLLDDMGLLPAVRSHIERYTAQTGVRVDFKHSGLDRRFSPEVETAVYRVVQEALTNVARHADTDMVSINILADGTIKVQIDDHGKGFDVEQVTKKGTTRGLAGMRERLRLLGGDLTIEATPGKGTRLIGEVPEVLTSEPEREQENAPKQSQE